MGFCMFFDSMLRDAELPGSRVREKRSHSNNLSLWLICELLMSGLMVLSASSFVRRRCSRTRVVSRELLHSMVAESLISCLPRKVIMNSIAAMLHLAGSLKMGDFHSSLCDSSTSLASTRSLSKISFINVSANSMLAGLPGWVIFRINTSHTVCQRSFTMPFSTSLRCDPVFLSGKSKAGLVAPAC